MIGNKGNDRKEIKRKNESNNWRLEFKIQNSKTNEVSFALSLILRSEKNFTKHWSIAQCGLDTYPGSEE